MQPRLPMRVAAGIVIALYLPYAILNLIFLGPALTYTLGGVIALASLGALWLAGRAPWTCFVRLAPLSRQGALLLALLSVFIPLALLLGRGQALTALDDLVYAPASALGQELYFRAALLAALDGLLARPGTRGWLALVAHAALFALWHARAFRAAPPAAALAVLLGTFVAGLLWAIQTRRDGTMLYAFAQHALFLIVQ